MARFPGNCLDLNDAVEQLRHLELEKGLDEIRMAAGHDDRGTLALLPHLEHESLDPGATIQPLIRDPLGRRHDRFCITEVEHGVTVVDLLHNPGDQVTFPTLVPLVDLLPLGVT